MASKLVNTEIFVFDLILFLFQKLGYHVVDGLLDTREPRGTGEMTKYAIPKIYEHESA